MLLVPSFNVIDTTESIKCNILKNASKLIYKQKTINFDKFKIILTYSINDISSQFIKPTPQLISHIFPLKKQNNKVIIFLPGYNNYFYYHHVRLSYPDYDFFSLDIPGYGFNGSNSSEPYEYLNEKIEPNYFDNIDNVCDMINSVLSANYSLDDSDIDIKTYNKKYLMGFSTGGFIATNYVYKCDTEINNKYFKFDKLLLVSPLTKFYLSNNCLINNLTDFILSIINIFNKKTNLNLNSGKPYTYALTVNKLITSIYEKMTLKNNIINDCDKYIINTNVTCNLQETAQLHSGWFAHINNTTTKIIKSNKKIITPTKLVFSKNHTSKSNTDNDNLLYPKFIIEHLSHIISHDSLMYKQFTCGHDALLEPFDNYNNDNDNISFVDICDFLLD